MNEQQKPERDAQIGRPLALSKVGGLAERMQACCEPLGLQNENAFAGQTWSGEVNGRFIKIHASIRRRTRYAGEIRYSTYAGHTLEISTKTSIKTRLNLTELNGGLQKAASRTNKWMKTEQLAMSDPAYEHLDKWASEPAWAEAYLAETDVRDAMPTLLPSGDAAPVAGLKLWPENWTYTQRLSIEAITPEAVAAWVEALLTLADVAEDSPPMNVVEPTWLERQSPMKAGLIIVGGILGTTLFLSFCCTGMLLAASFLFITITCALLPDG
jgi:hypothetical protein